MITIEVNGAIVGNDDKWIYDWYEYDSTCPKDVKNLLAKARKGEEVEVLINSPGGSVFAGSEIYTVLKDSEANITVKIVGIAASAASVVAMSGNKVIMSPTAQLMIHNAAATSSGDYRDMEDTAEILKGVNESIANAYELKTKLSKEELLDLMNKETFFTAQSALEKNFIDEIMFQEQSFSNTVKIDSAGLLPQEVINKMKSIGFKNIVNLKDTGNTSNETKKLEEKIKNEKEVGVEKAKLELLLNLED